MNKNEKRNLGLAVAGLAVVVAFVGYFIGWLGAAVGLGLGLAMLKNGFPWKESKQSQPDYLAGFRSEKKSIESEYAMSERRAYGIATLYVLIMIGVGLAIIVGSVSIFLQLGYLPSQYTTPPGTPFPQNVAQSTPLWVAFVIMAATAFPTVAWMVYGPAYVQPIGDALRVIYAINDALHKARYPSASGFHTEQVGSNLRIVPDPGYKIVAQGTDVIVVDKE